MTLYWKTIQYKSFSVAVYSKWIHGWIHEWKCKYQAVLEGTQRESISVMYMLFLAISSFFILRSSVFTSSSLMVSEGSDFTFSRNSWIRFSPAWRDRQCIMFTILFLKTTTGGVTMTLKGSPHKWWRWIVGEQRPTCLSVRRLLASGSSTCSDFSPAGSWNSSSSSAFSFAMATTAGGKAASSATWIPKLWSHTPGHTVKSRRFKLRT